MKNVYTVLLPIVLLGFTAFVGAAYSLWRANMLIRQEDKARALKSVTTNKEAVQVPR
jgi:hypothetical protein